MSITTWLGDGNLMLLDQAPGSPAGDANSVYWQLEVSDNLIGWQAWGRIRDGPDEHIALIASHGPRDLQEFWKETRRIRSWAYLSGWLDDALTVSERRTAWDRLHDLNFRLPEPFGALDPEAARMV